jgi:hypothetical protein
MNFQEKLFETTADIRSRAEAIAHAALQTARQRADVAAKRVKDLRGSIAVLNGAGREFNKVARRHATRFVKENSAIASQVRDDVSALALSTLQSLTKGPVRKTSRKAAPRKRAARKAH